MDPVTILTLAGVIGAALTRVLDLAAKSQAGQPLTQEELDFLDRQREAASASLGTAIGDALKRHGGM